MKPSEWFKNKLNELDSDTDFRLERLILEITEEICRLMEKQDMSRSELARSLGVSPPAVTKILRGESNFTLRTLLSLANVLDMDLDVGFREKGRYRAKGDAITTPKETVSSGQATAEPLTSDSSDSADPEISGTQGSGSK